MPTYKAAKALRYAGVSYAKGDPIEGDVKPRDARALLAARVLVAVDPTVEAQAEPAKAEQPAPEAQADKKRGRYERRDMRAKP